MKKTIIVLILLFAAVSAFALSAKVLDVVGKVEYQKADGSWVPVSAGTVLGPGTVLSTGFKSEAVISVDESTITVKALTRLTIEKLYEQEGNKASSFYLDAGAVGADVKSAESKRVSFVVKTPAVTASVRGTAGNLTVNRLVGTSGTWLLSPPQPKLISYNRGDAAPVEGEETSAPEPEPEISSSEESGGASSDEAESAGTSDSAEKTGVDAGSESEGEAESTGDNDEADVFDWSIDNGEVTVKPGQEATFALNQDIVTPMQTAAAASTKTGGIQTLSSKESVVSGAPTASAAASGGASEILSEVQSSLSSDLVVTPQKDNLVTPEEPQTPEEPEEPEEPEPEEPKEGIISIITKWLTRITEPDHEQETGDINIDGDFPDIPSEPSDPVIDPKTGEFILDGDFPDIPVTPYQPPVVPDTSGSLRISCNWPTVLPPEEEPIVVTPKGSLSVNIGNWPTVILPPSEGTINANITWPDMGQPEEDEQPTTAVVDIELDFD